MADEYLKDYSAIGALGGAFEGFSRGMADAEDRKYKRLEQEARLKSADEDKANKAFSQALEMRKAGVIKDATGNLIEDPGYKKRDDIIALSSHGQTPVYGEDGKLTGAQYTPEFLALQKEKANADPYGLKGVQLQSAILDRNKKQKDATQESYGMKLPPDKVLLVQQGAQVPKQLEDISKTLENVSDIMGPVAGRVAGANPYNEKARTAQSQIKASAQAFGRYMEGGVLRKEDEIKYQEMFPNLSDTPEIAKNKLAIVNKLLVDKQNADVKALADQGYDTRAFSQLAGGEVPKVLRQKDQATGLVPKGLVSQAQGLVSNKAGADVAPKASGPKKGTEEGGYVFQGGDPADPKNWKKK